MQYQRWLGITITKALLGLAVTFAALVLGMSAMASTLCQTRADLCGGVVVVWDLQMPFRPKIVVLAAFSLRLLYE